MEGRKKSQTSMKKRIRSLVSYNLRNESEDTSENCEENENCLPREKHQY